MSSMLYYSDPTYKTKLMEQISHDLLQNSLKEKKSVKLSQLSDTEKEDEDINTM